MITSRVFDTLPTGDPVTLYTMENANGMKACVMDFGATLVQLWVPDRDGKLADVVCGYDRIASYMEDTGYQGAVVGRVGNRIRRGTFTLDGQVYHIAINNGVNSLHGGAVGFSHKMWKAATVDGEEPSVIFTYISPDGEENYPGTLMVKVIYTLTKDNALSLDYQAITDKTTIVNLTNHSYFNLQGYATGNVLDHTLWMDADTYLPTDETLIPTGEMKPVDGTPFDFRTEKTIGRDFSLDNKDMGIAGGYDHCMNFVGGAAEEPVLRAVLTDPTSGRTLSLYTDAPCVQFYSANFTNNPDHPFKNGVPQQTQMAVCLETQKMPDSINQKGFTNVILEPDELYTHHTTFAFGVRA